MFAPLSPKIPPRRVFVEVQKMTVDRVAIITGSAQGLGKGIAEKLCHQGYGVVVSDLNDEVLNETYAELKTRTLKSVQRSRMSRNPKTMRRSSNMLSILSARSTCTSTTPELKAKLKRSKRSTPKIWISYLTST